MAWQRRKDYILRNENLTYLPNLYEKSRSCPKNDKKTKSKNSVLHWNFKRIIQYSWLHLVKFTIGKTLSNRKTYVFDVWDKRYILRKVQRSLVRKWRKLYLQKMIAIIIIILSDLRRSVEKSAEKMIMR